MPISNPLMRVLLRLCIQFAEFTVQVAVLAAIVLAAACSNVPSKVRQLPPVKSLLDETIPPSLSPDRAQELGRKLMTMIDGLQVIDELTDERIESTMSLRLFSHDDSRFYASYDESEDGSQDHFWNERLTQNWWVASINLSILEDAKRPKLIFELINLKSALIPMTAVCIDIYKYGAALKVHHGFEVKLVLESAGKGVISLEYRRPGIERSPVVELIPAFELKDSTGSHGSGRGCLKSVVIR